MGLAYGSELQKATAVQSFWNGYYSISDPFEGLVYSRPSTQKTDTYTRLGAAPMPEEWTGDREAKDANEYSYDIVNKPYDASVSIDKELILYQQWDEVGNLIANLGQKARAHKTKLSTTLIEAGAATVCEDGQFFYDTDHVDAGAAYTTSQDNDLTSVAATDTQPTVLEGLTGVRACFDALWGFKDDRGDPTVPQDENPANYILMVPPVYRSIFKTLEIADSLTGPIANDVKGTFMTRVNPFITGADAFYFFYAGSSHKPIIHQESSSLELTDHLDPDSGDTIYSATWHGRVQYGQWRSGVLYTYS